LRHSRTPGHAERLRRVLAVTAPGAPFRCSLRAERDVITFAAGGEIDIAAAAALDADLGAARDLGFEALVVDLRDVRVVNSTGVDVLDRWTAAAARDGFEFGVVSARHLATTRRFERAASGAPTTSA